MRFQNLITVVAVALSSACSASVGPHGPDDGAADDAATSDGAGGDGGGANCGDPYTLDPSGRCLCDHGTCGSSDWCCATYPLSGTGRWGTISCRPAMAGQTMLDNGVMYCHVAY